MSNAFYYNGELFKTGNTMCKIIAHRGYHVNAPQNTIQSIIEAVKDGFTWCEIDIRKTNDNIYVLSHDNVVTLYNGGVSTQVTITSSNYSTIKNYTWDSSGRYKINTLQAVFNALKCYNMNFIIDLKNGDNKDIMQIAILCGVLDRIMLTYQNGEDISLYKKYDSVPIRIHSSYYDNIIMLQDETVNPLYADYNATGSGAYTENIAKAIKSGIPIIFSGATLENKNVWEVLASGVMANTNLNISFNEFYDAIKNNYNTSSNITTSTNLINIGIDETITLNASNTNSSVSGYIYAYSNDMDICGIYQTTFGSSATFNVVGRNAGNTEIVLFTGDGMIKTINVTVE